MPEPWKVFICESEQCLSEAFNVDGSVREEYRVYPDIDTPEFTQFTCRRCGHIETWGVTRRQVMKILYERTQGA